MAFGKARGAQDPRAAHDDRNKVRGTQMLLPGENDSDDTRAWKTQGGLSRGNQSAMAIGKARGAQDPRPRMTITTRSEECNQIAMTLLLPGKTSSSDARRGKQRA